MFHIPILHLSFRHRIHNLEDHHQLALIENLVLIPDGHPLGIILIRLSGSEFWLENLWFPNTFVYSGPPPFKDSPLSTNINESATGDDDKQLFLDILLLANRSRSGRNVAGEVSGRMETDLSADLTVVPKTAATGKAINGDQQQQMKMDIFDSTKKSGRLFWSYNDILLL